MMQNEEQTRHYASMIGRRVGRQITILEPLMDAHLAGGDRVNATLAPISIKGNTITLRKFAAKPWTITDFIKSQTTSTGAAALIWLGVQFELSSLIAGGTASGKTSMLNVVANFFPPNQRIISIEDTREIRLPKFLHWVPMITRLPNPEGKGEISMLDLLVNSLRQRPDRIIVGEIRRKREAEVLFEAIHTGHSVYATVHANDSRETITRLVNPPIEIPRTMLPAISMMIVQYRNRRTGVRRTFQVSEILPNCEPNVLIQLDIKSGKLAKANKSKTLLNTIGLFTGFTKNELNKSLKEKESVLKWLVKQNINTVDGVGRVMAEYYTNTDYLMKFVKKNKPLV
jgi:flagellar protein FlaI